MNNEFVPGFDDDKDDTLKISLEIIDGVDNGILVSLNGYIDTYNSVFFQKQVGKIISAGYVRLIFACSNLSYVSSTGIGSFTSFLKLVKPRSGDIVLMNIQPKVYEVFQLLGFSQFFHIKENLSDSIKFFSEGDTEPVVTVFPKVFNCPVCNRKLKASKSGRFRCSDCKSIIAIDQTGNVFLG